MVVVVVNIGYGKIMSVFQLQKWLLVRCCWFSNDDGDGVLVCPPVKTFYQKNRFIDDDDDDGTSFFPSLINSCLMTKFFFTGNFNKRSNAKVWKTNWKSYYNDCIEYFFFLKMEKMMLIRKKCIYDSIAKKKTRNVFDNPIHKKNYYGKFFFTRKNSHFSGHQFFGLFEWSLGLLHNLIINCHFSQMIMLIFFYWEKALTQCPFIV